MKVSRVTWLLAAALVMNLSGCGSTPPTPSEAGVDGYPPGSSKLSYSNKWRVEVSEGANSSGEIVFHVTQRGGDTQVIAVAIEDGTRENKVARTIRYVFEENLDGRRFHVEVDDGEDVLVKKLGDEPNFALEAVSSTVKSVRLRVQKE